MRTTDRRKRSRRAPKDLSPEIIVARLDHDRDALFVVVELVEKLAQINGLED